MNTKIKLFIPSYKLLCVGFLLTFGFAFLFTQNSFAFYTKTGNGLTNPVNIGDTNPSGYLPCTTLDSERQYVPSGYDPNALCLFNQSNINKALYSPNSYGANPTGVKIDGIKIPYYIAKNLWKTIDSTGPSYPNALEICSGVPKNNFYNVSQCAKETRNFCPKASFIPNSSLSSTFTIPQIYDNVKTEIIRSCLPGKITTQTAPVGAICCEINKHKCPNNIVAGFGSNNYTSFTYDGCGPLSSSMSMSVETNATKYPAKSPEDPENNPVRVNIGTTGSFTVSWGLSNPSANCELWGFDANTLDSTKALIKKIDPKDVEINIRATDTNSTIKKPATGNITYTNPKMGIYTYTYTCAGVLNGKDSPPKDGDKSITIEKKVFVGPIPNKPKINSFTIVDANGKMLPTAKIQDPKYPNDPTKKIDLLIQDPKYPNDPTKKITVPEIYQTDSFKICWNATAENPKITVSLLKNLAEIRKINIPSSTDNLNICLSPQTLPPTNAVPMIGLWGFELEVKDSKWSDSGLESDILNIPLNVVPIDPVIEKFAVLAKDKATGNWIATTSVSVNEPLRFEWKVLNTQGIKVNGDNYNDSFSAGINTIITSPSPFKTIIQNDSDLTSPYTYTLTADDLFYPNRTVTKTIKLYRNEPGKPTISKFEFNPPSVIKRASDSGNAYLNWIIDGAKSITLDGPGTSYGGNSYPWPAGTRYTRTVQIPISTLGVGESKYSITACPTSTSNPDNCSTASTTLMVYSSEDFDAELSVESPIVGTGKSTTLSWNVHKNDKIKSYSIVSDSGVVIASVPSAEINFKLSGSKEIFPTAKKTTYTLEIQSIDPNLMPDFPTSVTVETADAPKINSFTMKKVDGTEFKKDENGITVINQTDVFKLCWDAKTENPKISITAFSPNSSQEGDPEIWTSLVSCVEKKIPITDLPIGLWTYKLKVGNELLSDKGLGSDTKELTFNVVSVAPEITRFEILAKDQDGISWVATSSVLVNEPIKLSWKVLNTNSIKIEGTGGDNNFIEKPLPTSRTSTVIEGVSNIILPNTNDLASTYTYTITANDLFYTNQPVTQSITLQRRQPGAPTISEFKFDKSSVTKKETSGSGTTNLSWVVEGAESIKIEGYGLPIRTIPYKPTDTIAISIDNPDISTNLEGIKYTITACPTATSNSSVCSTRETILKVYSFGSLGDGASISTDDTVLIAGNSTMLRWEVAPNDKIKSYSIISSSGDVNITESAETGFRMSGALEISPETETTYTLKVSSIDPSLKEDFSMFATVGIIGKDYISKFEFDKSSVTKKSAGGSGYVNLNWAAGNAKSINITGPEIPFSAKYLSSGTITFNIDNLSVAPNGLEYSLTACPTDASNKANCSSASTTLRVYSSDLLGGNLSVNDAIIRTGNSTKLKWDIAPNDKIKSYSITSTSGDVNISEVSGANSGLKLSGEKEISPKTKTTYTLNILSVNSSLIKDFSAAVMVDVTDKSSPTVEFSADKMEINKGDAVVLTWNTQNAKEVSINNNIGPVAKQGSITIYPDFTALYVLTAKSAQPGVIPDSEKTVRVKIITPGFEGLETADEWVNPTDLKTQYGLTEEAEANAKLGILDLKVNGVDGPITVASPANITLSWNLDKYCLATGSWLTVKTAAGTENITLKRNGKYTYNLYCPGTGSDSVEITVTGGQSGLLDNLLEDSMPIAEIAVSTDKIVFSTDARVIKGKEVELFIRADKDINGDDKASRDQNGEWGTLLSGGGGCLYNAKLTKDLQFDGGIQSPKSPQDCNVSLGKFTFNDEPGTYQYGIFKLVQSDGKFSNIAYITITVDGPPAPNSAPTIDFRINGRNAAEQTFGTPASYYMTWDVADADSCLATGSWNGIKPLKGIQNFLKSSNNELAYTLTCENELGISAKTIALKIVESPVCTFTAMPPTLDKKSAFVTESELSWKCNYADECSLGPNTTNATIKTYGSLRVSPDQTTNYTLNCTSSNISKSFEAKVEVSQ